MFRLASFTTRQLTNVGIKPIPLGDSFTVANYYNSQYQFDLYGAESASAYYGAFGPLISDNIYFIYKYVDRSSSAATNSSNNITWLGMADGSYAEFTVVSGCINGDLPGYTRLFTIGGTDYEFYWDGYQYANVSLPLDFEQLIGQTFSLVYNPAIQIPATPNTMLVAAYSYPGDSQNSVSYGANIDLNSTLFGRITNSAFKAVVYYHSDMNNYFNIMLADGTYDGFTVSGGSIDGDTSGGGARSTRAFTINGQVRSLEYANGQYTYYTYDQSDTDIFNLVSLVGQTVSLLYDPAAQTGANGTTASGTLVVGESPYGQGYGVYLMGGSGSYGSIILHPPFIDSINYSTMGGPSSNTTASIMSGTYGGVVVDSTGIDGKTSISMTIDGVTQTGTLQSMGGQALLVEFTGDAFNFSSKVGQTLSISFTVSDAGGGGGGEVTALLISNPEPNGFYNNSNHSSSFPPGPYTDGYFFFQSGTDRDAFVAAAPTTMIFNDSYGGNSWTVTGVSNINAMGPDAMMLSWTSTTMTGAYSGQPSLTYTSGGGGSGATYTAGTDYSNGMSGPPGLYLSGPSNPYMLSIYASYWTNTDGYAAVFALTSGSTFTITMPDTGATVYTLTMTSSWNDMGYSVQTSVTSDVPLSLPGGFSSIPATVSIGGGASGGGASGQSWYSVVDSGNSSTSLPVPSGADVSYNNYAMVKLFTGGQDMSNNSGVQPSSGMWNNTYQGSPFNVYRYQDSSISSPITLANTSTSGVYFAMAPVVGSYPYGGNVEYMPSSFYGSSVNRSNGLNMLSSSGSSREAHGVTVYASNITATAVNCTIHETKTGGPWKYTFWSMTDNQVGLVASQYEDMITFSPSCSHYTFYWTKYQY